MLDASKVVQWWKKFVGSMNALGIPLPTVRDPKTGVGSVSLTMMFISFNVVLIGLVGKYAKMLEGIDVGQSIQLFSICAALYFGRKMSGDKNKVEIEAPVDSKDDQK